MTIKSYGNDYDSKIKLESCNIPGTGVIYLFALDLSLRPVPPPSLLHKRTQELYSAIKGRRRHPAPHHHRSRHNHHHFGDSD